MLARVRRVLRRVWTEYQVRKILRDVDRQARKKGYAPLDPNVVKSAVAKVVDNGSVN